MMKKWMFLLAVVGVLVGFHVESAHAVPVGVPECGGHPGYVMCTELMGIISGPPVSIQNLGLRQDTPTPGPFPTPPPYSLCRITWSNGYSNQQPALVNGSCSQTYAGEVLGSWRSWGASGAASTYTAPIVSTP